MRSFDIFARLLLLTFVAVMASTVTHSNKTVAQEVYSPYDTTFDYDYDDRSIADNYFEEKYLSNNEFPDEHVPPYARNRVNPYTRNPVRPRTPWWDRSPYYQESLWDNPANWFDDNDYEYTYQDYYDPYDHDVGRHEDITFSRGAFRRALPR